MEELSGIGEGIPIYNWATNVEDEALVQIKSVSNLPRAYHHVALMPDGHLGYGMPIGGVAALDKAICPNMVGVDIGCGMVAVKTSIRVEQITRDNIIAIRRYIKNMVPVGEGNIYKASSINLEKWDGFDDFFNKHERSLTGKSWWTPNIWKWASYSLGTLGGGNHFMEIQAGHDGYIWMMAHSGSRNLGYKIASYYHNIAKEFNELWDTSLPINKNGNKVVELSYLPTQTPEAGRYIRDMSFALRFAEENRRRIMNCMKKAFVQVMRNMGWDNTSFDDEVNIHHNFAEIENHFGKNVWVHRKGATQARAGKRGIILGSQGTASYIVEGLNNPLSFNSCSHGAGRVLGRREACRRLNAEEETKKMGDVIFDSWKDTEVKIDGEKRTVPNLEEASGAYKNIDEIMEAQKDLVKIITKLTPLGVIKG